MNRLPVFVILFITICLGVASCAPKHDYYSEFLSIDSEGWDIATPLVFTLDDSTQLQGDLTLTVRHDAYYGYRNLWLFVDYVKRDSMVERDTIDYQLADISGNWLGNGFGSYYEKTMVLRHNCSLDEYEQILVHSGHRERLLKGVSDIGISLFPKK